MGISAICLLGVGLSMDAFAVAVCKGLQMRKMHWYPAFWLSIFFGGFQALMPLAGYLLGAAFATHMMQYSHWVAFLLLLFIGGKMLLEAIRKKNSDSNLQQVCSEGVDFREFALLAVATSIDALAVGVTFSVMPEVSVGRAVSIIGGITFGLTWGGIAIGTVFGNRFEKQAGILGGSILIAIGIRILLEGISG